MNLSFIIIAYTFSLGFLAIPVYLNFIKKKRGEAFVKWFYAFDTLLFASLIAFYSFFYSTWSTIIIISAFALIMTYFVGYPVPIKEPDGSGIAFEKLTDHVAIPRPIEVACKILFPVLAFILACAIISSCFLIDVVPESLTVNHFNRDQLQLTSIFFAMFMITLTLLINYVEIPNKKRFTLMCLFFSIASIIWIYIEPLFAGLYAVYIPSGAYSTPWADFSYMGDFAPVVIMFNLTLADPIVRLIASLLTFGALMKSLQDIRIKFLANFIMIGLPSLIWVGAFLGSITGPEEIYLMFFDFEFFGWLFYVLTLAVILITIVSVISLFVLLPDLIPLGIRLARSL